MEQSVAVPFLHADSLAIREVAEILGWRGVRSGYQPRTYANTSGATIDAEDRTPVHAPGQVRPREHRDSPDAGTHFPDLT
jgi:hypothetical protein